MKPTLTELELYAHLNECPPSGQEIEALREQVWEYACVAAAYKHWRETGTLPEFAVSSEEKADIIFFLRLIHEATTRLELNLGRLGDLTYD